MKFTKTLTIIGTAAILFASCSQQRYAHRAKVKVDEAARQTAVKKHKDVIVTEVKVLNRQAQVEQLKHDAVKALPVAPTQVTPQTNKERKTQESGPAIRVNPLSKETLKQPIKKLKSVKKFGQEGGDPFASKWFKLMILGLIIALIGTLIGIVLGPIGWLVNAVGGVIFLIGLILWLLELVQY